MIRETRRGAGSIVGRPIDGAQRSSHPLLNTVRPDLRASISAACEHRSVRPGVQLIRPNDGVAETFWLHRGAVRRHCPTPGGGRVLVELVAAPAVIGHWEVLAGDRHTSSVTTVGHVELMIMSAPGFFALLREPGFARWMAADVSRHAHELRRVVATRAAPCTETRVRRLLQHYASVFGSRADHGLVIDTPLSQESIARDLSLSRQSVVRCLRGLRARGVVDKQHGRYFVSWADALSDGWISEASA